MSKSSLHIKKSVGGITRHNARENFSHSVVFPDEKNEIFSDYELQKKELQSRREKYTNRTGQKLQKTTALSLSAIVNLEKHHTLKDLASICNELEIIFDTKVYQVAIHRDEGKLIHKITGQQLYSGKQFFMNPEDNELYYDEKYTDKIDMSEYEIEKNYHAHIEFLGIDSEGRSIRKKMNKNVLSNLQTFVATALNMERGEYTKSYTQEQMQEITSRLKPKNEYKNSKEYGKEFKRVAKELGIYIEKRKRKDVEDFKVEGTAKEASKTLAKQKDLKAEIKRLRAELQEQGAERKDHAKLEQINRELKEQIKAKSLTIDDLTEKLESKTFYKNFYEKKYDKKKKSLSEAQETILNLNTTIDTQKDDLKRYEQNMSELEDKNKELESEVTQARAEIEELKLQITSLNAERSDKERALQVQLDEISEKIDKLLPNDYEGKISIGYKSGLAVERFKVFTEFATEQIKQRDKLEKELRTYRGEDRQEKRKELNATNSETKKLQEALVKIEELENQVEILTEEKNRAVKKAEIANTMLRQSKSENDEEFYSGIAP